MPPEEEGAEVRGGHRAAQRAVDAAHARRSAGLLVRSLPSAVALRHPATMCRSAFAEPWRGGRAGRAGRFHGPRTASRLAARSSIEHMPSRSHSRGKCFLTEWADSFLARLCVRCINPHVWSSRFEESTSVATFLPAFLLLLLLTSSLPSCSPSPRSIAGGGSIAGGR